jgi:GNAT superfamily N-acetyltransferase
MTKAVVLSPDQLDYDQHSALLQRAFKEVLAGTGEEETLSPPFFRWKYNGPIAPARIAVVREGDQLLAANSMYAVDVVWRGRRYRGWQSCDTATDPAARGKGYFGACLKALQSELKPGDLFFGFPNRNSIGGFLKIGWEDRGVLPAWARVVPRVRRVKGVEPCASFDAEFDSFRQTCVSDRPMIERSAAYMNWRYFQHPIARYEVFVLREQGAPQGYLVLRQVKTFGRPMALVLDLIASGTSAQARLLNFAARWGLERGLWPIVAFSSVIPLRVAARSLFIPAPARLLPKRQALLGEARGPEATEVLHQSWHLHLGDWDGF